MKILVPFDGSAASIRAVRLAIEEVKVHAGASLIIVNVQNAATLGLTGGSEMMPSAWIEQQEERAATDALREAVTTCREAGVSYVTRSKRGPIAATINHVACEERVAHIIMGTRGLGGVRGLLLGSVGTELLHLTDIPVTFVK
jgi:nucleotide-binding universal stress UspA family protein